MLVKSFFKIKKPVVGATGLVGYSGLRTGLPSEAMQAGT
jgi:hypothetical protein